MQLFRPALAALVFVASSRADVLHVPADFENVQAAVDVASSGDEIVIAAGSYEGVILIDDKHDLRLRGQGKVRLIGSVADTPNLRVNSSSEIVLEHLIVADSEGAGIAIDNDSDAVSIRRCRVENSAAAGIDLFNSNHILIDRVVVVDSGTAGLLAEGSDSVTVTRCTFTGGDIGIDFLDGRDLLIDRTKVSGTTDRGIGLGVLSVTGPEESIVRKCLVKDTGTTGIEARGTTLIVENNRLIEPAARGVLLLDGSCLVRDNKILRPQLDGIATTGGAHQVLDNLVVQPGDSGLLALGAGGQLWSGNRVSHPLGFGMNVAAGSDGCVLVDNRVTASGDDGFVVNSDEVQASDNRVLGSGGRGLFVLGAGGVFAGNIAKGSVLFDLLDTSGNANTYVDNQFGTTQFE
jgi:hypothetical protein